MEDKNRLTSTVVDIVSTYVGNNAITAAELPALISVVHKTLSTLGSAETAAVSEPLTPAVSIKKSVGRDFIICLEDGRKFKSLKRHLSTKYGMTPDDYRTKWGLPKDYPMVAPEYAEARSTLAKQMGLGQGGRKIVAPRAKKKA